MTELTIQLPFVEAIAPLLVLSIFLITYGAAKAGQPGERSSLKDQALGIIPGMIIASSGIIIVLGLILFKQV